MNGKLKTIDVMEKIVAGLKADGKVVVTTNGAFDVLHAAHVSLFEKARAEGDVLVVLLNSDASIKRYKGDKRPIVSEKERANMLAALENVDYVVIFNDDTPLSYLERIKPHLHAKGGTAVAENVKKEVELLLKWNGQHKQFPLEEGYSTTNIIEKVIDAYVSLD